MKPICPRNKGFILQIPSAGIPQGFYLPPDKSYRVAPPPGWAIVPSSEGGVVEFQSRLPNQGYWPVMFIAMEPVEGPQALSSALVITRQVISFRFG